MGTVPQNILSWLRSALTSGYRNVNRTYSDVAQTLSYHPNFALRTDVYIYENGGSALLLNLQGTLPVKFRGITYAFPISIWIPQEYPDAGPIGFVTPTKEMTVRAGQYVSGEGKIYHPYLRSWRADRSSLYELFSILQGVFEREPPVVARQGRHPMQPQGNPKHDAPPPIPPLPPELGRSDQEARTSHLQPPPPPPKPFDSRGQSNININGPPPPPLPPQPVRNDTPYGSSQSFYGNGYARVSETLPQHPPQWEGSLNGETHGSDWRRHDEQALYRQPRQEPFSPPNGRTEYHGQTRYVSGDMGANQQRQSQHEPPWNSDTHLSDSNTSFLRDGHQTSPYQNRKQQSTPQQYQQQQYAQQGFSKLPKPRPPEDLLTSPFENPLPIQPANIAPPPIPPNPQKDALLSALSQTLTEQIHSKHSSNLSALPPLRAQQVALTSTLNAVNAEISRLNDLETMLCSNESILHKALRDANKVLEDAKRREVPDADDVLVAPTVVAGQLYQSVAEERAIEESRGVLGRALDKGRIGGGVWARQTRSLAREEFLKKAMIKKISRGMGLIEDDRH